jgi:hypothetical protein
VILLRQQQWQQQQQQPKKKEVEELRMCCGVKVVRKILALDHLSGANVN